MKNKTRLDIALCAILTAIALATAGCGTTANLAGLGVSVNVAQKGIAAGLTLNAGTNAVTVGGSYSQGTNSISGSTTIPTETNESGWINSWGVRSPSNPQSIYGSTESRPTVVDCRLRDSAPQGGHDAYRRIVPRPARRPPFAGRVARQRRRGRIFPFRGPERPGHDRQSY